jgi:hypothetical protein
LERVVITKCGRIVAMLLRPEDAGPAVREMHGFMCGSVSIPPGFDLTVPAAIEQLAAEHGVLLDY